MDIKEQIKFHRNEINKLEDLVEKKKTDKYNNLVGKYFKLSKSDFVLIKSVDYVFHDYESFDINCSICLIDNNKIQESISYNFELEDLETEITREEFIQQLDKFVNNLKQKINEKWN